MLAMDALDNALLSAVSIVTLDEPMSSVSEDMM